MKEPFEATVGLMGLRGPAYLGSNEKRSIALPIVSARWNNGWFAGTSGIGYRTSLSESLTAGVRMSFDLGRKESWATALRGMGDVSARAELGAFASYRLFPELTFGGSFRYGSGEDRRGMLFDLSVRTQRALGSGHSVYAGLTGTYANQAAMRSLFGVNAAQSAASHYAIYAPGAGARDVSLNVGYGYAFSPNVQLTVGLTGRTLLGDAKDSPLVKSTAGVTGNLGLLYRF